MRAYIYLTNTTLNNDSSKLNMLAVTVSLNTFITLIIFRIVIIKNVCECQLVVYTNPINKLIVTDSNPVQYLTVFIAPMRCVYAFL